MSKQDIAGRTVVGAAVAGLGYAAYVLGIFTVLKWTLIAFLLIGLVAKIISVLFGIGHFEKVTPERIKFHQARAEEDAHPLSPELGARPGRSE